MSKRFIFVLPFAGVATAGLFGVMTMLIDGEWAPQDKSADLKFEINPVENDIEIIRARTKLDKVKRVETPPPPQRIDTQSKILPSEPVATIKGAIPDFKLDGLVVKTNVVLNMESKETPLVRIPPQIPSRAERSGHCVVRFDINAQGAPFNITTPYCSQNMFSRPTLKAVSGWKYRPAMQDGAAQTSRSVETKVVFRLMDENGEMIPE